MAQIIGNQLTPTFNDLYAQRPVWAIASTGTTASNNSPVVAMYNEFNPYNAMNVESSGAAKSRSRGFQDEMLNSSYSFLGNTTSPTLTGSWSPSSAMFGINGSTQTGGLNNFDIYDNGSYGYYSADNSTAFTLASSAGIVTGESNWRQCYELILTSTGKIYKEEIGGTYTHATSGNRPFIDLSTISGFSSAGSGNWGVGQIAHNRKSKRLLVVQPNGGVNTTSLTFRLHFFDLQNAIGRNTTIAQLKQWITDACAGTGGTRYRYADVVFSSTNCYYSSNTTYDSKDTQFVLCDNDEVWAFKSSDAANTSTYNVLFRVNLSGGTYLTGTYTATAQVTFGGNSVYGIASGTNYGVRHMNSDDNSVVALFQHAYYYVGGYNIVMVSTKDASNTSYNYTSNSGTNYYTLAPTGGPNFVLCNSYYNNDSAGPWLAFLDNQVLAGTTISTTFSGYMWPSYNSSTCYGGNMVLKVQPTSEWK